MSSPREEILSRIRAAIGREQVAIDIPRRYRRGSDIEEAALIERLTHRLLDYRASVHPTIESNVADLVRSLLADCRRVVAPSGLPSAWMPLAATIDEGFSAPELDEFDAVITGCAAACAETGTIVLDAGPDQGRRAITLVPDRHVCVVRADQVVATIPELLDRLDPHRPLTFISGPSATSDIELQRVEGVHGPRQLVVILVTP